MGPKSITLPYPSLLASFFFVATLLNHAQTIPLDHAEQMATSAQLFQTTIGPLLREHCLDCHGGEKTKSGFSLANREAILKGGDQGITIVPHQPTSSPLLAYLSHEEEPFMPPKKPKLSSDRIESITRWIELGAAYDKPLIERREIAGPMEVDENDRNYWAYRSLSRPTPPRAQSNPIDAFVSAERAKRGITASPPISRIKLARRLWFDLLGLPPSPEDIRNFVADPSRHAVEKLVDRLLANQHFGERWARHWLDVARFGESHGFEHDSDRPHAYHYRDFVTRAFNADMPYDQFVRWQIAGDELAPDQPLAKMATGFLGAGVFPTQITISDAERVRYDALDDMIATMGSAMLATTIGCARCHDHKYDPIPTRDYYSLLSAFTTTVRTEVEMDLSSLASGDKETVMICSEGPDIKPMRLHTSSGKIPDFYKDAYHLHRGDVNQKGPMAQLGFLQVLVKFNSPVSKWEGKTPEKPPTSGKRRAVAQWITDTESGAGHLLARVIVNRLWQHHFGVGLVATPNDFGFQGETPSHPELLEWLAHELITSGWRLKHIHKLILLTETYQMGDKRTAHNLETDPENRFLWHRPPRRLQAECIRDNALAVSGALDPKPFGPGTLDQSMKRRSLYFQVKRSQLIPIMQLFDWPDALTSLGARAITTTPSQALIFINSPAIRDLGETFANSLLNHPTPVDTAYWRAFGRPPSPEESSHSNAFLDDQTLAHQDNRLAALTDFCQALMSMNEFIYVE